MTRKLFSVGAIAALMWLGCTSLQIPQISDSHNLVDFPDLQFQTISDTHVFSRELVSGPSPVFEEYLKHDRKLLLESLDRLDAVLAQVKTDKPAFLLISGDLTKDGERVNHLILRDRLHQLKLAGVQTYVIPGNHDLDNPHAVRFFSDRTEPIPSILPAEFAEIYAEFGYGQALSRDPASLSYVVEPVPGLWLVGVDSVQWEQNRDNHRPTTAGRVRQATVDWLAGVFQQATSQGKALIVFQHHGLIEHFRGQREYLSEYLVKDDAALADFYLRGGVRLVFTGHQHAQDAVIKKTSDGRWIMDIETGSLVTPPVPLRSIQLKPAGVQVTSRFFEQPGDVSTIRNGLTSYIYDTMRQRAGMSERESGFLSSQIVAALMAHYRGDETLPEGEIIHERDLSLVGSFLVAFRKDFITSLWNDPNTPDNNFAVNRLGEVSAFSTPVPEPQITPSP